MSSMHLTTSEEITAACQDIRTILKDIVGDIGFNSKTIDEPEQ